MDGQEIYLNAAKEVKNPTPSLRMKGINYHYVESHFEFEGLVLRDCYKSQLKFGSITIKMEISLEKQRRDYNKTQLEIQ